MVRHLLRRLAILGGIVIALEIVYALLRPSPEMEEFDPSGTFGDPTLPTLRVAVIGDSSVTAPGVAGPEEIWVSRVCTRLAETRHVVLASFAVGGSRASDVIADQLDPAMAFQPDLVLVSVGANDAIRGVPLRRFAEELDFLIGALATTGALIVQSGVGVLGTIPRLYPPLSTLMTARSARFDRIHREVASHHGSVVIEQRSDHPELWNRDRSLWAADYFHVSAAGHARWADTTWRALEPIMNGSGASS